MKENWQMLLSSTQILMQNGNVGPAISFDHKKAGKLQSLFCFGLYRAVSTVRVSVSVSVCVLYVCLCFNSISPLLP